MTIVKTFTCAYCGNQSWKLSKNRYATHVFLQFECSVCGTRPKVTHYDNKVETIEELIDLDDPNTETVTL